MSRFLSGAFRLIATISVATLTAGCAVPLEQSFSGYSCCNLRANAGWISSNNVQGGDLIPLGEPIKLTSVKRSYYVYGTIGTIELGFRDDSANSQADAMRWVRRIVVENDPRVRLSAWSPEFRSAINAARVMPGMNREQVTMALGYPSSNDTPDLAAAVWRYWTPAENLPVDLRFDADGKLVELTGTLSAVRTLELRL
jgi:hypothetical protein